MREGNVAVLTKKPKRKRAVRTIIIRDVAAAGIVLVVFAAFHHALPRPAAAIGSISEVQVSAPAAQTAAVEPTPAGGGSTPEPTAAPTAAPGDFSATFPTYDTGAGALYSYQSDDLRIAISMVQENDITYYIADVRIRSINAFRTAFAKGQFGTGIHQAPLKIAGANNAIFAVTGDYCGARGKGVVIRNGDLYRDSVNSDVCVLFADGTMRTYAEAEFSIADAINGGAWQAWSFGPQLLDGEGRALTEFTDSVRGKNPRNAIGYYEPGHYCFVTVDGRQSGYSVGMTLAELADLFASLGCRSAYNLDGGATAEMIF